MDNLISLPDVTRDELNTLIHGLYILEDQRWYKDTDISSTLITKLNVALNQAPETDEDEL